MTTYQYQLLPELAADEYQALKADIAKHGVLVPVEIDQDGALIDGHNFAPALGFIAGLACLGMCSYLFVVGKIVLDSDNATPSVGRKA